MLFKAFALLATLSLLDFAQTAEVHGTNAQGKTMGPVSFLWPADRLWSADADNIGPCGSSADIGNRTEFPLGSAGSVSFSIADESYKVALRIAYGNDPTSQSDFQTLKGNVSVIEEGHQCYSVPNGPESTSAGSNATIQLEYWSNDSGKDESFFACADITFVEAELFTTQIPCFNVTASEFTPAGADPSSTSTTAPTSAAPIQENTSLKGDASNNSSEPLTAGAKAGIAVGAIFGAALVVGAILFIVRRQRQSRGDAENTPAMTKVASFASSGPRQRD